MYCNATNDSPFRSDDNNILAASMSYDNVYPVTIALKEQYWKDPFLNTFIARLFEYTLSKGIEFIIYKESGKNGNVHFHGIFQYPQDKMRLNFKTWICKNFGKYRESIKHSDYMGWIRYIQKCYKKYKIEGLDIIEDVPYLFSPTYEHFCVKDKPLSIEDFL